MPNSFMGEHVAKQGPGTGGKFLGISRYDKPVEYIVIIIGQLHAAEIVPNLNKINNAKYDGSNGNQYQ